MKKENKSSYSCLLVVAILFRAAETFPAYVNLFYFNTTSNITVTEQCECGVYGANSPLRTATGLVGIPKSANLQACDSNTEFTVTEAPWIALIERGNCRFLEKIKLAAKKGAEAVVIYNAPESGGYPIPMAHSGPNRLTKSYHSAANQLHEIQPALIVVYGQHFSCIVNRNQQKNTIAADLTKRKGTNVRFLKLAKALDPRFKNLKCLPKSERAKVWSMLSEVLKEQYSDAETTEPEPPKKKINLLLVASDSEDENEYASVHTALDCY